MDNNSGLFNNVGNWDWQPKKNKEQPQQLMFSNVALEASKENDLLTQIEVSLNKVIPAIINILKK